MLLSNLGAVDPWKADVRCGAAGIAERSVWRLLLIDSCACRVLSMPLGGN